MKIKAFDISQYMPLRPRPRSRLDQLSISERRRNDKCHRPELQRLTRHRSRADVTSRREGLADSQSSRLLVSLRLTHTVASIETRDSI